ncbi:MAG: hypothetical protein AAB865_03485 [Patescibacteria group bacterium]
MHEIFLGAAISGLMGFLIAVPALLLEASRRGKNLPIVSEIKVLWNVKLTESEVFAVSLLLHLVVATLVGGLYVLFVRSGWWLIVTGAPFELPSILLFTVVTWLVLSVIIFPILGMGFFASREGKWVWFEMLVTHVLIAVGFWLGVMYYHPFFF